MTTESAGEDDNFGTESSQQAIMKCLGGERRNRVLAGLYMGRSDTALMVRQAALHVRKVGKNRVLAGLYMERTGCWPGSIWNEPKNKKKNITMYDLIPNNFGLTFCQDNY